MTLSPTTAFNLRMQQVHPTWYDHIHDVEAAMARQAAEDRIFLAAGWSGDEDQWISPWGHPQRDWEDAGLPVPTDWDYAQFLERFGPQLSPEADLEALGSAHLLTRSHHDF